MKTGEFAESLARFSVVNFGAAGSFVAVRPGPISAFRTLVERALPHPTDVMYLTAAELTQVLQPRGPSWDSPAEGTARFLTVLSKAPVRPPELPIFEPGPEQWVLQVTEQIGPTVLSLRRLGSLQGVHYPNPAVEKAFGVPATTRGWNTVAQVARAMGIRPPD